MCFLGAPHAPCKSPTFQRKGAMAAWPFAGQWKLIDLAPFRLTLVAILLALVLGDCGPPPELSFASPINQLYETNFKTGTILKYECHLGYRKVNLNNLTCDVNGAWIYIVFCTKKRCRNPGELANGKIEITGNLLFGSTIRFSCSEGYILIGSTTSQCEIQGKGVDWSDPLPECVIVKCESPPDIPHGKHSGGDEDLYTYGSSVTYSCDPHFSLVGNVSISCMVVNKTVGVWSPSPPICKKIICHQPEIPNANFISGFGPFYHYKDSIVISCKKGYILKGSSLIHCEPNNEWYPSVPTCVPGGCIGIPNIAYSSWDRNIYLLRNQEIFDVGTQLKYHCKLGYAPAETQTVTCKKNLTWVPSRRCERVCCPKPNLEKIRIISERQDFTGMCVYAYGDYVFYMCDEGYHPVSKDGRSSCQANGKWKPQIPACKPALCPKPYVKNGKLSVEKAQYIVMENVSIQCDFGYEMIGSKNIICSENKIWLPEVPKCQKEIPEGCEQVIAGRNLMQCLPNPEDVKLALLVYKLSLEINLLEQEEEDKYMKIKKNFFKAEESEG